MSNKNKEKKFIKVVYFDEVAATDYITIQNGGHIDWSTTENKEKLAKILAEIDAQAKGGINIISVIKAVASGHMNASFDSSTSSVIKSTVTNTLLTDYISIASKDKNIGKFHNGIVYAPEDSITMYKMYSSYLNIVPKEQMPIDLGELNKALLGERGYYQMLFDDGRKQPCVLRFNIAAFKNSYTLADLSKMNLSYFGVKVGSCSKEQLSLDKEFEIGKKEIKPDINEIVTGEQAAIDQNDLDVFDIVLAGVMSNE